MLKVVLLVLAVMTSGFGMALLSLAKNIHWKQLCADQPLLANRQRGYRMSGGVLLAMALGLCLLADNASIAILVWIMSMALAVVTIAFVLGCRPHWLRILVR